MIPTLTITRWNETFESADTRKRQRLRSFHCPSGIESRGLLNLLCHFPTQDALAAFGVFQLLCQLSATLPAAARGRLVHSDFSPMSEDYLARLLRIEICHLSAALQILEDSRIGWVSRSPTAANLPPICHLPPGFVQGEGEGEGEGEERESARPPATAPKPTLPAKEDPITAIRQAYPRRTHIRDTVAQIAACLRRHPGRQAEILAGTRAIAAAVAGWTENERLQFLKPPPEFFAGDHWQDDPEFWRSNAAARAAHHNGHRPAPGILDTGHRRPAGIITLAPAKP
jgi:hypothetical protein